jgi:hypothetical protein
MLKFQNNYLNLLKNNEDSDSKDIKEYNDTD